MQKSQRAAQARRELDRRFASTNLEPIRTRPRHGWIRAVRDGLGMSQRALAHRLHIAPPNVSRLEKSEANGTISIGKLAEIAHALDCTLVYALVPNSSLDDTVRNQARRVAAATLGYVDATMRLEDQAIESDRRSELLDRGARDVISSHRVWPSA